MFIDYLTLMMIAVVMGTVSVAVYGNRYLEAPREVQRSWAYVFWFTGLLLGLPGFFIIFGWPLPGAYNIVMGEPAVFFGSLLFLAGLVLWRGDDLGPLSWMSLFGGGILLALVVAILRYDLTRSASLWALGYGVIGLAAVLTPFAYKNPGLRPVVGALLLIGALIFAIGGYGGYIDHTAKDAFGRWVPLPMR